VSDEDVRLRESFTALRRQDAARAPGLAETLSAARSRPARPHARWWLVTATTAGLVLLFATRVEPPVSSDDFAVGSWRMPSDVLLETPGSELLGSPAFQTFEESTDLPTPGRIGPQSRIDGRSHG